jgi:hypothetical protein
MVDIQKNSREVIRVSASEYEGHDLIDLRVWYDDDGDMKPTKKGIAFNPSKAKEVIEAILQITEETNWKNF